jgi:hypothetical protein
MRVVVDARVVKCGARLSAAPGAVRVMFSIPNIFSMPIGTGFAR